MSRTDANLTEKRRTLQLETIYDLSLALHGQRAEQDLVDELLQRVCAVLDPAAAVAVTRDAYGGGRGGGAGGWGAPAPRRRGPPLRPPLARAADRGAPAGPLRRRARRARLPRAAGDPSCLPRRRPRLPRGARQGGAGRRRPLLHRRRPPLPRLGGGARRRRPRQRPPGRAP